MSELTKEAREVLLCSLATCGGDRGPMFPVARAIATSSERDLGKIEFPQVLNDVAQNSLRLLEKEAEDELITPRSVLWRYGHPDHFHDMGTEENLGPISVAAEIPAEFRPLAHTLLPLTNGMYVNEGRIITFRNLVPLGPQKGRLVVHLAGAFACHCSENTIRALLEEQASDLEFMKMADRVGTIDYGGTRLREATLKAKEILGLQGM